MPLFKDNQAEWRKAIRQTLDGYPNATISEIKEIDAVKKPKFADALFTIPGISEDNKAALIAPQDAINFKDKMEA